MAASVDNRIAILSRVVASLLGGYIFTWGVVTFGITVLVALGVVYDQAYLTFKILGFLIFLCAFLGAYIVRNLIALWGVFITGGGGLTLLAWILQNQLIQGG